MKRLKDIGNRVIDTSLLHLYLFLAEEDLPSVKEHIQNRWHDSRSVDKLLSFLETGHPQPQSDNVDNWQFIKPGRFRFFYRDGVSIDINIQVIEELHAWLGLPFKQIAVSITTPSFGYDEIEPTSGQKLYYRGHGEIEITMHCNDGYTFEQNLAKIANRLVGVRDFGGVPADYADRPGFSTTSPGPHYM